MIEIIFAFIAGLAIGQIAAFMWVYMNHRGD